MGAYDPTQVDVARLLALLGMVDAELHGDVWVARCPGGDHQDRKPSWSIVDRLGDRKHAVHHCFSCKYNGTAAELVALRMGIQVRSAVDWIIEHAMGSLPDVSSLRVVVGPLTRGALQLPPGVVVAPLVDWPALPREYAESRGITAEQVDRWRLGYAVEGRLKGRVFLPAWSPEGRLLNYTARTFASSPKRYLAASREEGPDEGAIFGELWWLTPIVDRKVCTVVITEGALNALAAERALGHGYYVASLFGSEVQLQHLMKLAMFDRALVLTDPDLAGDRAAEFLIAGLVRHMHVGRVVLERGTDAASIPSQVLRAAVIGAGDV